MKKIIVFGLVCMLCSCVSYIPVNSVISDISYTSTPNTHYVKQVITCDDGHTETVKQPVISLCDIGSVYTYYVKSNDANIARAYQLADGKKFRYCEVNGFPYDKEEDLQYVDVTVYYTDGSTDIISYIITPQQLKTLQKYDHQFLNKDEVINIISNL